MRDGNAGLRSNSNAVAQVQEDRKIVLHMTTGAELVIGTSAGAVLISRAGQKTSCAQMSLMKSRAKKLPQNSNN